MVWFCKECQVLSAKKEWYKDGLYFRKILIFFKERHIRKLKMWRIDMLSLRHFSDVPSTHPYFKYIQKAGDLGIFYGYSNGTFGPDDCMIRAHLAVALYNAFGR